MYYITPVDKSSATVFLAATFPAITVYSRNSLFEFPLAAMTALSYLFLIRTDSFKRRGYSIFFGISSGLAILTKTMGVVFLVMPFFYTVYVLIKDRNLKAIRQNIIYSLLSFIAVISIYYVPNFKNIFSYLLYFGFGEGSRHYTQGVSEFLSVPYWTIYLRFIIRRGIPAGLRIN